MGRKSDSGAGLADELAGASEEDLAAFAAFKASRAAAPAEKSPGKWAADIDAVADGDVNDCVRKLSAVSKASGPAEFVAAMSALEGSYPELVAAAKGNSEYRKKPLQHSINVAIVRLSGRIN